MPPSRIGSLGMSDISPVANRALDLTRDGFDPALRSSSPPGETVLSPMLPGKQPLTEGDDTVRGGDEKAAILRLQAQLLDLRTSQKSERNDRILYLAGKMLHSADMRMLTHILDTWSEFTLEQQRFRVVVQRLMGKQTQGKVDAAFGAWHTLTSASADSGATARLSAACTVQRGARAWQAGRVLRELRKVACTETQKARQAAQAAKQEAASARDHYYTVQSAHDTTSEVAMQAHIAGNVLKLNTRHHAASIIAKHMRIRRQRKDSAFVRLAQRALLDRLRAAQGAKDTTAAAGAFERRERRERKHAAKVIQKYMQRKVLAKKLREVRV
jgi:hypothetical protein